MTRAVGVSKRPVTPELFGPVNGSSPAGRARDLAGEPGVRVGMRSVSPSVRGRSAGLPFSSRGWERGAATGLSDSRVKVAAAGGYTDNADLAATISVESVASCG